MYLRGMGVLLLAAMQMLFGMVQDAFAQEAPAAGSSPYPSATSPIYVPAPPPAPNSWVALPAVPPPPPMPVGPNGLPPRPLGKPQYWVTDDDYPAIALRESLQGSVRLVLDVDTKGRVSQCTVTKSSGWPVLDVAACSRIKARANFSPAVDGTGAVVPGKFRTLFTWRLGFPVFPWESWAQVTRVTIEKGVLTDCAVTNFGTPADYADSCAALRDVAPEAIAKLGGGSVTPVAVTIVETSEIPGQPLPRDYVRPAGEALYARHATLTIGTDGYVRACQPITQGILPISGYLGFCVPSWSYPARSDFIAPDAVRRAVATVAVLREPAR